MILQLNDQHRVVLDAVASAAIAGRECPTNAQLNDALGGVRATLPPQLLAEIESEGSIYVERGTNWRVVTIVKTGAQTKRPAWAPPPRDEAMPHTIGRPDLGAGEKRKPYVDAHAAAPTPSRAPRPTPPSRAAPPPPVAAPPPTPPPPTPEPEPAMPEPVPAAPDASQLSTDFNVGVVAHNDELLLSVYLPVSSTPFLTIPVTEGKLLDLLADGAHALRSRKAA